MTLTNRAAEVSLGHTTTLPQGWAHATLGDVLKIVRGVSYEKADARKEVGNSLIPILRATNIGEKLDFDDLVYVPSKYVSDEQMLRHGDIVVAASSGSLSVVGKAARLKDDWCGSFGAFCMGLRVAAPIESAYVAFFLGTTEYRHGVSNLAAGSNINNLRRTHIESFSFPLAPLPEQKRIVAKIEELFSDLDAGVAALGRVKAKLKRYRAAVLKAAVEGRLTAEWRRTHPATESADKLLERILAERRRKWEEAQLRKYADSGKPPPKGWREKYRDPLKPVPANDISLPPKWCWTTIDQLTHLVTKGSSPGWQGFEYTTKGVIFVRSQNVRWGVLDLSDVAYLPPAFNDEHSTSIIKTGDVLLNLVGASVGRAAIATPQIDGANLNQAVGIIRLVLPSMNRLLVYFIISPVIQAHITTNKADVARANFNLDDVRPMPVLLPPDAEQEEIAAEIERRLSVVEAVEAEVEHGLKRAARLRQAILKRAFAGKLVPQDPADEPAAKLLERIRAQRDKENHNGTGSGRMRPRKAHTRRGAPTLG